MFFEGFVGEGGDVDVSVFCEGGVFLEDVGGGLVVKV